MLMRIKQFTTVENMNLLNITGGAIIILISVNRILWNGTGSQAMTNIVTAIH